MSSLCWLCGLRSNPYTRWTHRLKLPNKIGIDNPSIFVIVVLCCLWGRRTMISESRNGILELTTICQSGDWSWSSSPGLSGVRERELWCWNAKLVGDWNLVLVVSHSELVSNAAPVVMIVVRIVTAPSQPSHPTVQTVKDKLPTNTIQMCCSVNPLVIVTP